MHGVRGPGRGDSAAATAMAATGAAPKLGSGGSSRRPALAAVESRDPMDLNTWWIRSGASGGSTALACASSSASDPCGVPANITFRVIPWT